MDRRRHVPLRSCIVCGSKRAKRELTRIAATPDGDVALDPTSKAHGRGTYICGDGGCIGKGLQRGRLEYALRVSLDDAQWIRLLSSVEALTVSNEQEATTPVSSE